MEEIRNILILFHLSHYVIEASLNNKPAVWELVLPKSTQKRSFLEYIVLQNVTFHKRF